MGNRRIGARDLISVVQAAAFLKATEVEGMRIGAFKTVTAVFKFHCISVNDATASDDQRNQNEQNWHFTRISPVTISCDRLGLYTRQKFKIGNGAKTSLFRI